MLQSLKIQDFLAFTDKVSLDFSQSINVIIGENGSGKSTVLKALYWASVFSQPDEPEFNSWIFTEIFGMNNNGHKFHVNADTNIDITSDNNHYIINLGSVYELTGYIYSHEPINYSKTGAVFIPTTEMLSHSKGFLALNQKYKLPFDSTQVDIIVNASLPETRTVSPQMSAIMNSISKVIDGTVTFENDVFYVVKNDGTKVEFSLEAEGLRKLGLIWKLIRNGLLESGTVLLWDEPEANINPELFPLIADILLELQRTGVQIFIATHSYNLAKYLEIRRDDTEQVKFHNLFKNEQGVIESASADSMEGLQSNQIIIADDKLLDEVYKDIMG